MKKTKSILPILIVILTLGNLSFAATLPLNTGYDYSNYTTYPAGSNDNYWIRIASYPPVSAGPVGPSWAIVRHPNWALPMTGNTGVASMWINAFGANFNSPGGISSAYPGYAIYRKCFCLPQNYGQVSIRGGGSLPGGARADDSIQIWLNSVLNTVLPPSNGNYTIASQALPVNYGNQNAFKVGPNCLYALVEDAGTATGFDLAANLVTSGPAPIIPAKGVTMVYEPCGCSTGGPTNPTGGGPLSKAQTIPGKKAMSDDEEAVDAIIKIAETRRTEKMRSVQPKN